MLLGQSQASHFVLLKWSHLLSLFLMPFHHCAQAQSGISSMPPYGFSLREKLSVSFTIIVVAFLSALVFVGFFTLYIHHCAHSNDAAGNSPRAAASIHRGRINREITNNCPILVYSTVKDLKIGRGALECAVCLGEFQDSDKLRLLPKCHHVFHPDCIDAWLASHMTCPICRGTVLFDCGESAIVVPIETNTNAQSNSAPGNPTTSVSATTSPDTQLQLVEPNAYEDVENNNTDQQAVPETNNVDETAVCQKQRPPPEVRMLDKLTRSPSTVHSPVQLEEKKIERGILMLPEHVSHEILQNHSWINQRWERSDVVLAGVWCSKKGFRWNEGEGNSPSDVEPWRLSMTPLR